jgi:hypothetical protein
VIGIFEMIGFTIEVSGGSYRLKFGARERLFPSGQRALGGASGE